MLGSAWLGASPYVLLCPLGTTLRRGSSLVTARSRNATSDCSRRLPAKSLSAVTGPRGRVVGMAAVAQSRTRTACVGGLPQSRGAMTCAVIATVGAALVVDVLAGEHPIHTLALVVLVGAVTGLRRWIAPRFRGLLSLLNATIVAQPALHLAGKWLGRSAEGSGLEWPAPAGVWHGLVPDGVTGTQLAATVLIVAMVLICGAAADLVVGYLRARFPRLAQRSRSVRRPGVRLPRVRRHGSMLRWCGWRLQSARRGPPGAGAPGC